MGMGTLVLWGYFFQPAIKPPSMEGFLGNFNSLWAVGGNFWPKKRGIPVKVTDSRDEDVDIWGHSAHYKHWLCHAIIWSMEKSIKTEAGSYVSLSAWSLAAWLWKLSNLSEFNFLLYQMEPWAHALLSHMAVVSSNDTVNRWCFKSISHSIGVKDGWWLWIWYWYGWGENM